MNKVQRFRARQRGIAVPLLAANNGGGWAKRCLVKARTGRHCLSCRRRWNAHRLKVAA